MPESLQEIDTALFNRVWHVIREIGISERHFNLLQQKYRALASTWLLASIGGAGFVLEHFVDSPAGQLSMRSQFLPLLLSAIGGAGGIGILLLWNLDLFVYQRLLDSNFVEGLRLESEFPWLPSIRKNMMAVHRNRGIMPKVVWFYSASSSILLFPVSVALFYFFRPYGLPYAISLAVVQLLGAVATEFMMVRRTKRIDFNLDYIATAAVRAMPDRHGRSKATGAG